MIETVARDWNAVPEGVDDPDFNNLLAVLGRSRPARPTLFEFFLNDPLYARLAGGVETQSGSLERYARNVMAFRNAGYDYATLLLPGLSFAAGERHRAASYSLNEGAVIHDRASFDAYPWPDPAQADYGLIDRLAPFVPSGMKLIIHAPGGVLENAISLLGYDTLCFLTADDPALVEAIFEAIGSRLVDYYRRSVPHEAVGAIIGNDDWGFKSQTMLPPDHMRRLVFPWHKQIVAVAHAAGKPAILHSCGCLTPVMDDVIDDMRYDAKHSYEDTIQPVEDAYDQYHHRIALLGGIDVDFVCRADVRQVYARSQAMLARADTDGAYALGTGNSVPEYVPDDHYFAMIRAVLDARQ